MVQITRQKQGGLGLSIKGGAEHKLPILISRIYKDQAADITGQLFVGDAIIKVNGEYITACPHDDAVNILRNAGDIVVLTVKHYRAATPFLQKQRKFALDMMYRYPSSSFPNSPSSCSDKGHTRFGQRCHVRRAEGRRGLQVVGEQRHHQSQLQSPHVDMLGARTTLDRCGGRWVWQGQGQGQCLKQTLFKSRSHFQQSR